MEVYIKENSLVAKIAAAKMKSAAAAIVFGRTIYLHNCSREKFLKDTAWVCHELKHVEQYRRYGFAGFLARYLSEWITNGYTNNRFEREAREYEKDARLLNEVRFM